MYEDNYASFISIVGKLGDMNVQYPTEDSRKIVGDELSRQGYNVENVVSDINPNRYMLRARRVVE